ncbi:hypothetical protein QBC47DRAFT_137444 [Echria macrotheca]|uniref:DUF6590 domain-containing protein n=1 Tax=Echria macrotheca TaxID=438768 RepID=A0AAJ0BHF2_9PEZI|nr:hypothetical protein QBC47DRAFT_137444 [Echria macrotheca]
MTAVTNGIRSSQGTPSGSTQVKIVVDTTEFTDNESDAITLPTPETSGAEDNTKIEGARPRPQGTQYGYRWEWDEASKDYIHLLEDGSRLLYTVYQKEAGGDVRKCIELQEETAKTTTPSRSASPDEEEGGTDEAESLAREAWRAKRKEQAEKEKIAQADQQNLASKPPLVVSSSTVISKPVPPPPLPAPPQRPLSPKLPEKKHYENSLDPEFDVIRQPRRFFCHGRIFKAVWFEPYGADAPARRADLDWTDECKPFYDTKPMAKFRWFVVVRRRLNHSLCFSITTFGGPGSAAKSRRGRAVDFVVLHRSSTLPPEPYPEEEITRAPLSVIIEEGEQYISPWARLDCGRIYTVEHNLKVMKIGRIHPDSLDLLEDYFRKSVEIDWEPGGGGQASKAREHQSPEPSTGE